MTHRSRTRVLLVTRFRLVAQTLDLALSPTCLVVPVPTDSLWSTEGALAQVVRRGPDVVLVDADLGGAVDAHRLVEELAAVGLVVIVLTCPGDAHRGEHLRRGAAAAFAPEHGLAAVRDAVARVAGGLPALEPAERARLLGACGPADADRRREVLQRLGRLSRREAAVLWMLMHGRVAADIARAHVVAEATVRTQVKSILRKLEVTSQLGAVCAAWSIGWRPPVTDVGVPTVVPLRAAG